MPLCAKSASKITFGAILPKVILRTMQCSISVAFAKNWRKETLNPCFGQKCSRGEQGNKFEIIRWKMETEEFGVDFDKFLS